MARSDSGAAVSVSVELLLPETGSVVPDGAVTLAVFFRLAVAEDEVVPLTVNTTELPAPAAMLTVALRSPEPLAPLLTEALPVVLEVHVSPVRPDGKSSATVAPTAMLGPALVTVML